MGYMTVVSILNDGWQTIKENPQKFIENIEAGMHSRYDVPAVQSFAVGNYANPMEVHRSEHSNWNQLLLVGGNHMEDITDFELNRKDDFYLGYKIAAIRDAQFKITYAMNIAISRLAEQIINEYRKSTRDIKAIIAENSAIKSLHDDELVRVLKIVQDTLNIEVME